MHLRDLKRKPDKTRCVMRVNRFLSERPFLALCRGVQGRVRESADLIVTKIKCLLLRPCLLVTQNVLSAWIEICSW